MKSPEQTPPLPMRNSSERETSDLNVDKRRPKKVQTNVDGAIGERERKDNRLQKWFFHVVLELEKELGRHIASRWYFLVAFAYVVSRADSLHQQQSYAPERDNVWWIEGKPVFISRQKSNTAPITCQPACLISITIMQNECWRKEKNRTSLW